MAAEFMKIRVTDWNHLVTERDMLRVSFNQQKSVIIQLRELLSIYADENSWNKDRWVGEEKGIYIAKKYLEE